MGHQPLKVPRNRRRQDLPALVFLLGTAEPLLVVLLKVLLLAHPMVHVVLVCLFVLDGLQSVSTSVPRAV